MLPPIQSLNHLSQKSGWRLPERRKERKKVKVREFTRYEKVYTSGKFISKSLARFHKPKIVKGTSFLSWVYRNGKTDQWFALPKIKKAKKVKAKDKSKSFFKYRLYL